MHYLILTYTDQPMLDLYVRCLNILLVKEKDMTTKANGETREEAGRKLFNNGCVSANMAENGDIQNSIFNVDSETRSGFKYNVTWDKITGGWVCTCPDHTYHNAKCKHIIAVEYAISASKAFANTVTTAENIKRRLVARGPSEIDLGEERGHNHGLKTELTDLDWKLIQDSLARTSASFFDILHRPGLDRTREEVIQLEYDSLTELLGKIGRIRKQRYESSQL
jgi:SWIM zinc finger